MMEFLMSWWVEVAMGLLFIALLLIIILVNMCYHELVRKYEEEHAKELSKKEIKELQKMMPKLPEEEK